MPVKGSVLAPHEREPHEPYPSASRFLGAMNSELKVATLVHLALHPDTSFGESSLFSALLSLEGEERIGRSRRTPHHADAWIFSKKTPFHYCKRAFVRGRLVVPDERLSEGQGYRINESHRAEVLSMGNMLYQFSLDHNVALSDLIGMNPQVRLKMYENLLDMYDTQGPLSFMNNARMMQMTNLSARVVGYQARELAKDGIISYQSVSVRSGESAVHFKKGKDMPDPSELSSTTLPRYRRKADTRFFQSICKILTNAAGQELTIREIHMQLRENYGYKGRYEHMQQSIGHALEKLSLPEWGFVERVGEDPGIRSRMYLTDEQAAVLRGFITLVRTFEKQKGHVDLALEIATAESLFSQTDRTRGLFRKAYLSSGQMKRREEQNLRGARIQRERDKEKGILAVGGIVLKTTINGEPVDRIIAYGADQVHKLLTGGKLPMQIWVGARINQNVGVLRWRGNLPGYLESVELFVIKPQGKATEIKDDQLKGDLEGSIQRATSQAIEQIMAVFSTKNSPTESRR